jgi:O-antigen/teichoic acid export membrane protein
MAGVLFPAFSGTARTDPDRAAILFDRSSRYTLLALFPGVLLLFFFSREILTIFFGAVFAGHGSAVLRWLAIGVLINGLAIIPSGFLQAAKRPDLTAKFHVAEAPIYLLALFLLLPRFGVAGAAASWTLRVALDSVLLYAASAIVLPATRLMIGRIAGLAVIASIIVACGAMLPGLEYRVLGALVAVLIYALVGWYRVLDAAERSLVTRKLAGARFKAMAPNEAA